MHYRTVVSQRKFQELLSRVGRSTFERSVIGKTTWDNYFANVGRDEMAQLLNETRSQLISDMSGSHAKGATVLSVNDEWEDPEGKTYMPGMPGNKTIHIIAGSTWGSV